MELKKVQKQGRDERTQEDYPTSGVYFCRCRVVYLRSFIPALFLYFFSSIPNLKSSFTETFFPSRIRKWIAEAISSLAMTRLSAVWYRIWRWNELYLKIGLQPPKKEQKTRGEKFLKKTSFRVGMELKKSAETRPGEKASRTLPHYGTMPAPSLASNAMHLPP